MVSVMWGKYLTGWRNFLFKKCYHACNLDHYGQKQKSASLSMVMYLLIMKIINVKYPPIRSRH